MLRKVADDRRAAEERQRSVQAALAKLAREKGLRNKVGASRLPLRYMQIRNSHHTHILLFASSTFLIFATSGARR